MQQTIIIFAGSRALQADGPNEGRVKSHILTYRLLRNQRYDIRVIRLHVSDKWIILQKELITILYPRTVFKKVQNHSLIIEVLIRSSAGL